MQEELGNKQFYITPAHPCSYLPHQQAQTLFLDPRETISPTLYEALTRQGFRRSGSHLYRPHCRTCQACIPTRIPVNAFAPKRRQRRVAAANPDLRVVVEPAAFAHRYYDLYERYVGGRHQDGDMYPPSTDQFRSFLLSQWCDTVFVCSYLGDELVATAVTDRQPGGLSAVYTFFDPDLAHRSLGVFSVLQQIELCRRLGLPHLYLGYWVRDCQKMRYKTDYRPIELLVNGAWVRVGGHVGG